VEVVSSNPGVVSASPPRLTARMDHWEGRKVRKSSTRADHLLSIWLHFSELFVITNRYEPVSSQHVRRCTKPAPVAALIGYQIDSRGRRKKGQFESLTLRHFFRINYMSCTGVRTRKQFLFLGTAATTENGVNILLTQSNNFTGNVNLTCNVAYQGTGAVNAPPTCSFAANFIPHHEHRWRDNSQMWGTGRVIH